MNPPIPDPNAPPPPDPAAPPATPDPKQMNPQEFEALAKANWEIQQLKKDLKDATGQGAEVVKQLDAMKADPVAAFTELGGNVSVLADRLSGGAPTADDKIDQVLAELKDSKARAEAQDEKIATMEKDRQDDEYLGTYMTDLDGVLKGEEYKVINEWSAAFKALHGTDYDMKGAIKAKQKQVHAATGNALTPAQAAGIMLEEAKTKMEALRGLDFMSGGTGQEDPKPQTAVRAADLAVPAASGDTLTNELDAAATHPDPNATDPNALLQKAVGAAQAIKAQAEKT